MMKQKFKQTIWDSDSWAGNNDGAPKDMYKIAQPHCPSSNLPIRQLDNEDSLSLVSITCPRSYASYWENTGLSNKECDENMEVAATESSNNCKK